MINRSTQQLLNVVSVNQVVWIDDDFRRDHRLVTENLIAAAEDRNPVIGTLVSSYPFLADLAGGRVDPDAILTALRLESNERLKILEDALIAANAFEAKRLTLLASALSAVLGKISLETIDFEEWDRRKPELLKKTKVMYLVDLENGQGTTKGIDVLKEIFSTKDDDASRLSVVLTNTCQQDGEIEKGESIKGEIDARGNIDGMVSVMAKSRLISDEGNFVIDSAFSKPLHRICVRRITGKVARKCAEALSIGIESALEAMNEIPISDMEEAVFARTWSEGGSELDVISRIFSVSSRSSLNKSLVAMLKEPPPGNFFKQLEILRQLITAGAVDHSNEKTDGRLITWRTAELFDDGDLVNGLHSPLECGDIFEKENGGRFVLVCAPCDLMVRGTDAKRQANEGVFLPIRTISAESANLQAENKDQSSSSGRKYFLPSIGDGEVQEVRFNDAFSVNLQVLDWCVWNKDGSVSIGLANKPHLPGVLQVGWNKRLSDAHERCRIALSGQPSKVPPEYATLCLFPDGFLEVRDLSSGAEKSKHLDFKLKRVGRLRTPYSDALLAAYLADAGRHGFDHDFARRARRPAEQISPA